MPTTKIQLSREGQLYVDLDIPAPPADNRFYVVLHGLISLVETATEFHAYALSVGDEHRYQAGNWLLENDMPKGFRAQLLGVNGVAKSPDNSLDAALSPTIKITALPNDTDAAIWARLVLPRPRKIHYLHLGQAAISNTAHLVATNPKLCGLTILEYGVTGSFDQIGLYSLDGATALWKSSAVTDFTPTGTRVATLHVIDSPSAAPSFAHSQAEFALSAELFGQATVQLSDQPKDLSMQPSAPDGLSHLELITLKNRPLLRDRLADFVRTAKFTVGGALSGDPGCKSCCSAINAIVKA